MRDVLSLLLFLFCFCALPVCAASPKIVSVEPPSWWRQTAQKSIRLLVRGENLTGGEVALSGGGARLGKPSVSADGRSLFVDLKLDKDAPLGPRPLSVGSASATFTVLDKPAPRSAGIGPDDVVYLIMPDRFCDGDPTNNDPEKSKGLYDPTNLRRYHGGDLAGIRKKLPYLKDLGVTALWLTPLYDNADFPHPTLIWEGEHAVDYHGYGATDFYAIDEHFGSPADLKALIDDARKLGIKIVQDQVANHSGPFHPFVKNPPTPTWYHGTPEKRLDCDWNMVNLINPHATEASKKATLQGWFAGVLPDLNQEDPECRRYLIQNALWWVGVYGFDAIRQDTAPYVARDFWRDWHAALRKEFPGLTTLGEVNLPDPAVNSFYQRGAKTFDGVEAGFDHLYDFPLYVNLISAFVRGESLEKVNAALAHDALYANPSGLFTFLGLHDEPRFLGHKGANLAGLKLGATFLFTSRGIPLWYYGDEVALTGGGDPDNRRHFPGGFPIDKADKFAPAGRTPDENDLFDHIRRLTKLRADLPALRRGQTRVLLAQGQSLVYARTHEAQTVLVALNNDADKAARLTVDVSELKLPAGAKLVDALTGKTISVSGPTLTLSAPPRSAVVLASPRR